MKQKLTLTFLIIITFIKVMNAQTDAMISNYMFCQLSYNPAFAGISTKIDASLLARQQWVGLAKAPSTQILNFNNSTKKLGNYGISLINDRLGFERSVNLRLIYAYPIKITQTSTLSAGFGLGFLNKTLDGTKLKYENRLVVDPSGEYNLHSEFKPAIDFGFVYASPKLKIGASSTHITNSDKNATFYNVPRHVYVFGSYKIKLNNNLDLEPSVFVKSTKVITQIEANANLIISNKYWLGLSYRNKVSMNILAGMNLNKYLKVAYAYDYDTGKINAYSTGSHEIMLILSLDKNEKEDFYLKTPRLFN